MEKKEEKNNNGFVELLMNNLRTCIEYTLEVIEYISKWSNCSDNESEQTKLKEKKDFYQFGSGLIEKWSQNYYPAGIIDSNISTMLSRLQPHIPEQVITSLVQWNKLTVLFSTEQYRKVMGIQNDKFWERLESSLVVLSIVCHHSMELLRPHSKALVTNV